MKTLTTLIAISATTTIAIPASAQLFTSANGDHSRLHSGEELIAQTAQPMNPGTAMWLASPDGQFVLVLQSDCNVVLYPRWSWYPIWATNTVKAPDEGPQCRFTMQTDGNLVHYLQSWGGWWKPASWASNTARANGAHLTVQNDGNVVVYAGSDADESPGNALWARFGH